MAGLASINIKFAANLQEFSTQMQNANRKVQSMGKKFTKTGQNLTVGLTAPLAALAALTVNAAANMETLKTSLVTALEGSEDAADKAFDKISTFAGKTPFQLKEVADAFIKLKNLGLDPSERALTSYGNTASAMGKSLNQVIEAVADAATGEFERLKEFGIKSKSQGDQVSFTFKGVTKTVGKNAAEIQDYLLNIGEVDFAGGMERQSKTFNGQLSTLKDNINLLAVEFGQIILEYITPLVKKIGELTQKFRELSPGTKKIIVDVAALAAAIGPVLVGLGALATMLPAIGTALAVLTGPIGLVVAALAGVAVVIYKYWEPIKKRLQDIANYFVELYNESFAFRVIVESIVLVFKNMADSAMFAFDIIGSALNAFGRQFENTFKNVGDIIKAVLTGDLGAIPDILKKNFNEALDNASTFGKDLEKDWDNLLGNLKNNTDTAMSNLFRKDKVAFLSSDSSETDAIVKEIETIGETAVSAIDGVKAKGAIQPTDIINIDPGQPLISDFQLFGGVPVSEQLVEFTDNLENTRQIAAEWQESMSLIMDQAAESFLVGFGQLIGSAAQGGNFLQGLFSLMGTTIGNLLVSLGKAAIGMGTTIEAMQKSLVSFTGLPSIAAGVALVVVGTLIKSFTAGLANGGGGATPFANGGIVSGPVNALVGEYAGARNNPEVIAPLDKLKKLIEPAASASSMVVMEGEFVLRGNDLIRVINRTESKNVRTR